MTTVQCLRHSSIAPGPADPAIRFSRSNSCSTLSWPVFRPLPRDFTLQRAELAIWQERAGKTGDMDATPANPGSSRTLGGRFPGSGRPQFGQGSASAFSMKWSALHDAAETVALIAGVEAQGMPPQIRNFPVAMRDASASLRDRAEQGVEDMTAVMEPGLSALLAAHARGANPQPAALALWQEFLKARNALLALAGNKAPRGPLRST